MKERTIADIIEKVSTWRKLYNGVEISSDVDGNSNENQSKKIQKYSLEEAAGKVGISKKSLDDYLL